MYQISPIMMIMIVLVLGLVAGLDVCFVDPRQTDGRTDGSSNNQAQPFSFVVGCIILDQTRLLEKIHEWKRPRNHSDKAGPASRLPSRPGGVSWNNGYPKSNQDQLGDIQKYQKSQIQKNIPDLQNDLLIFSMSPPISTLLVFASLGLRPTTPRFGQNKETPPRCHEVVSGQPNSVSLPWQSGLLWR